MRSRPRIYGYALATVLLVLLVGWVGANTWHELRQLHRSFASLQTDDFYASEHVEASVRDLNWTVLSFDLHRRPAERDAFEKTSMELQKWIRAHQDVFTTLGQRK